MSVWTLPVAALPAPRPAPTPEQAVQSPRLENHREREGCGIKVGMIGVEERGSLIARMLLEHPDFELVAGCDHYLDADLSGLEA